jgi:hypothetical protein
MTQAVGQSVPAPRGPRAWARANPAFVTLAALLLAAAVARLIVFANYHLVKSPVPRPAVVRVDETQQRLTNFPAQLGPYELVLVPEMADDVLESLGTREHKFNWFYSSIYFDMEKLPPSERAKAAGLVGRLMKGGSAQELARFDRELVLLGRETREYIDRWRSGERGAAMGFSLDITYYTGMADVVAHAGARGAAAAGAQVVGEHGVPWQVPGCDGLWNKFDVCRTTFDKGGQRYYQYHVFSVNGRPTSEAFWVRLELSSPFLKYCYFAKVQIAPLPARGQGELSEAQSDELCRRFLCSVLPAALRFLPTEQDVKKLKETERASKGP